jgi:UDP-N-acetylglucosamine 2-epimerase (non-hydrolysing)
VTPDGRFDRRGLGKLHAAKALKQRHVAFRDSSDPRPHIAVTFGTRPEAIKMFPVVHELRRNRAIRTSVIVTAQHRELLDQVLALAEIEPDIDLGLMQEAQSLDALAARILTAFTTALDNLMPDRVLVHGDTLTTSMATMACFFRRIPVGHVEAGLRSGNIYSPWPEEVNRKVTGAIADLHFAPTERAERALRRENVAPSAIHVTGNTAIDALLSTRDRIARAPDLTGEIEQLRERFDGKRLICVTAHRRENFGDKMHGIAAAIRDLSERSDVAIAFPLHPNPAVRDLMLRELNGHPNIALVDPLDYVSFVRLMELSDLILTDSGGIQEEAPSLGKPVLVMRDETERPEAIESGTALLVGTDRHSIVAHATQLLDCNASYAAMAKACNPFGDGKAAVRIARIVAEVHAAHERATKPFALTSPAANPVNS